MDQICLPLPPRPILELQASIYRSVSPHSSFSTQPRKWQEKATAVATGLHSESLFLVLSSHGRPEPLQCRSDRHSESSVTPGIQVKRHVEMGQPVIKTQAPWKEINRLKSGVRVGIVVPLGTHTPSPFTPTLIVIHSGPGPSCPSLVYSSHCLPSLRLYLATQLPSRSASPNQYLSSKSHGARMLWGINTKDHWNSTISCEKKMCPQQLK